MTPAFGRTREVLRRAPSPPASFPGASSRSAATAQRQLTIAAGRSPTTPAAPPVTGVDDLRPRLADQGAGHGDARGWRWSTRGVHRPRRSGRAAGRERGRARTVASVTRARPAGARLGPARPPPLLRDAAGRRRLRERHRREPLEYRAGHAERLHRPRLHPARLILERAGGAGLDAQFDAWRRSALGAGAEIGFRPPAAWRPASRRRRTTRGAAACSRRGARRERRRAGRRRRPCRAVRHRRRRRAPRALVDGSTARSPAPRASVRSRAASVPGSSRALGWDTMLPTSSCGTRMSRDGRRPHRLHRHVALDRCRADRYVVFLSNRVHPSRRATRWRACARPFTTLWQMT